MNLIKSYWQQSKSPFYSLIFTIPLLVTYEIMIFSFNHSDIIGLRNGADVLFRQFFAIFDIYGFYLVGFVVLSALLVSYYFYSKHETYGKFQGKFFILMILESLLYALIMFIVVDKIGKYLMAISSSNVFPAEGANPDTNRLIALALGAGVYEEFIFRVVLVSGCLFFLRDLLKLNPLISVILSVLFASFVFSIFHYLGDFGEVFEVKSFLVRFGAGIFLSVLYTLRGYGITAYTHTFYDLIVIIM